KKRVFLKLNIVFVFYVFYFFLLTFNLSFSYAQDSLNVKWLGSCLGTQSMNVAYCEINGNSYLFVSQHGSILVLDINDPANPQKIIEIGHPGITEKTVVVDTILYVANGYYGLWIHNIADPYAPVRVGTCKTDNAYGVAVSGNYVYVADGDSGIVIIDVSQPSVPVKISSLYLQSTCVDIAVADTFAYIATRASLQIVNVADPFTPTLVGIWNSHYPSDDVVAVAVQGNFVFLANHWLGFWIVDVTNPQNPVSADSLFFGSALDITVDGNYAYGAAYSDGVAIINITDPYNVYLEGSLDTPGQSKGVDGCSNYVYVADRWSTRIINVIDPANPVLIGVYTNLKDFASDVAISGNYAYVTYRSRGLRIVDISNPYFPNEVGFWDTPYIARGIAVSDSYAYVADADSGLRIIDITNPFSPYEVGYCNTIGWVEHAVISGDYAYLACGNSGFLKIIDISNPAIPLLVSSLLATGGNRIVKQGKYVYAGRSIIDVSNPYAPFEIGRFGYVPTSGIAVAEDYLYVVGPFRVYDVSDHSSPVLLSSLDVYGSDIALQNNYAFIGSNDDNAIRVIDIANPFNLVIEGYYFFDLSEWAGPSGRLDVSDYNIYLAYFDYGLQIFRFTGAPGIEEVRSKKQKVRLQVYPNPFRQVTTIKFQIPSSKNQITMSIYNASGRLIRQWDYPTIRLSNQIIWNGVDDAGQKLPSGVYFCRLDIGEFSETQKILLLK
ncbi:T9SS type A sorting domain-containing protein, partial [candidate division WOR-3 bacterium]|nr:T9SS type A sorting domain-containing protein [candidate division WOR-3 bacterium]